LTPTSFAGKANSARQVEGDDLAWIHAGPLRKYPGVVRRERVREKKPGSEADRE
jgi:hypothetical protein